MSGEDTILTRVGGRPTVATLEDNTHRYTNSDSAVAVGDIVYVSSADTVTKADANGIGTFPPVGFVQSLDGSTNCYVVHSGGIATGLSGLTAGAAYYLGESAGVASPTPSLSGVFLVGVAINTTSIVVCCPPRDAGIVVNANRVGIGTDSPQSKLHIEHVDTTTWPIAGASNERYIDFLLTLRNNTDTVDAFAGIAFDVSTETDDDSIGAAIVATCADSTSTQHDTDLAFATNLVSDDDLTERMRITAAGRVGFGTSNPEDGIDSTYAMYASQGDSYCLKLHNDGDSNSRRGLYIACGSDDSLGTNYAVAFADGNDTWQGSIKFTGGTTSYMAFTAAHSAEVPEGHTYTYGTVMCVASAVSNDRSIVYNVTQSTSAMQTSVIGCYSDDNGGAVGPPARHSVCAVGDGHILVCSEGGNIGIGDFICSSDTAGHGMKQSGGSMMNYTVAKAFEVVDWSTEGSTTKLIACTYHSG